MYLALTWKPNPQQNETRKPDRYKPTTNSHALRSKNKVIYISNC